MLWVILGDYGSGKTIRLVLEGVSSKREVWGNFKLDIDNYTRITPMDLKDVGSNMLIILDEMQTWLESRVSMSFMNRFITNIIDQADKRGIDYFGTAHLLSSLDIRFRNNVHRIIKCERIGRSPSDRTRLNDIRDFRFKTLNTYTGRIKSKTLKYEKTIKYFELYDTHEIIEYPNQKDLELDLALRQNPVKAYDILFGIARDIRDSNGKDLTHSNIELALLKNGYSAKHGKLIHSCLKQLGKAKKKKGK